MAEENKQKELTPVEKGEKLRDEINEANKEAERLLRERKELDAENALSGNSGSNVKPEPKEETAVEYSKRVMEGGLNEKPSEE